MDDLVFSEYLAAGVDLKRVKSRIYALFKGSRTLFEVIFRISSLGRAYPFVKSRYLYNLSYAYHYHVL
jgi:hypothetical protein